MIPGVTVTQNPGADGASPAATVVRMLSPNADTTATITATPIGAAAGAPAPTTVPLAAGVPTEVELGGLAVGQYTVEVSAEAPVLAAVWQTTGLRRGVGLRLVHRRAACHRAQPVRRAARARARARARQHHRRGDHA